MDTDWRKSNHGAVPATADDAMTIRLPMETYDLNELGPWVDEADGTGLWTCDDKHANGPDSIWYNSQSGIYLSGGDPILLKHGVERGYPGPDSDWDNSDAAYPVPPPPSQCLCPKPWFDHSPHAAPGRNGWVKCGSCQYYMSKSGTWPRAHFWPCCD